MAHLYKVFDLLHYALFLVLLYNIEKNHNKKKYNQFKRLCTVNLDFILHKIFMAGCRRGRNHRIRCSLNHNTSNISIEFLLKQFALEMYSLVLFYLCLIPLSRVVFWASPPHTESNTLFSLISGSSML